MDLTDADTLFITYAHVFPICYIYASQWLAKTHLTLISKLLFFLLKPKETYQTCQMIKLRPLILHRQSNNPCQNHTALRWPLKPTCQSVEWSQSAVLRGTAHNLSEIKSKQCVRDSHRNSLSLGDSHTRWVTAAHPLTHNYTLQLGEWERGPGRRNNSFSVHVGWVTFILGVFPVENMLHFFLTITVDDGRSLGNRLIRLNIDQHLDIVVINI